MITNNIMNCDNICEAFINTPQTGDRTPKFVERMEAEHEWMNNEWMQGSILDPVRGTVLNQDRSKIIIYSLLFFLGKHLGDFLVAQGPSLNQQAVAHLVCGQLTLGWEQSKG